MRQNPYLLLIRPANLITSATDIAAGAAIASLLAEATAEPYIQHIGSLIILILSSVLLYAGGIALNDVFDAELDQRERPERPIPSGKISVRQAGIFALVLLAGGVILAFGQSTMSGLLATGIAAFSAIYNKRAKHHSFGGPAVMGFIRGLNLLLGLSIVPSLVTANFALMLFPIVYIFAITMISRGEVHGGGKNTLRLALVMFLAVDIGILLFGVSRGFRFISVIFAVLHLWFVLPPLRTAIRNPVGPRIGNAVKHGVLGMILLDALWVSLTPQWAWAAGLVLLLPVSQKLAAYFAVT